MLVVVTLVCCPLGYRRYQNYQATFVWVAAGSADWTTFGIVEQEMKSAGIDCICEGSVIKGVGVRRKDADRARTILSERLVLGRQLVSIDAGDTEVPGF
jgi:hypothetical protein